jgi:glutamate dehydrogenase/leucine dehydrogenase
LGRTEATGRGTIVTVCEALNLNGISVEGATVAVQGFGNVGSVSAKLAHEYGMKVVAVTTSKGGVHSKSGLDIFSLLKYAEENGTLMGFKDAETITNEELLTLDCDVLICAASEGQITSRNAVNVKAKIIAEGANGPVTPEGDEILNEKGVFIIPDILCNAGGVIVSYLEWVQDLQSFFWPVDEINMKLQNLMLKAFQSVLQASRAYNVPNREAAQIISIKRISDAIIIRGIYP